MEDDEEFFSLEEEYKFYEVLPEKNNIVNGFFPDRDLLTNNTQNESLVIPQGKEHYMLVLHVYTKSKNILVSFGTTLTDEKKKYLGQNSLTILNDFSSMGLHHKTFFQFDAENIAILPYNSKWFIPKKCKSNEIKKSVFFDDFESEFTETPITGKLISSSIDEKKKIINIEEVQEIIIFLQNDARKFYIMVPRNKRKLFL